MREGSEGRRKGGGKLGEGRKERREVRKEMREGE